MSASDTDHALVSDAKKVRDFGIRFGLLSGDELIEALLPFEKDPNHGDPESLATLRRAARVSFGKLDRDTLEQILSSKRSKNGLNHFAKYVTLFCSVILFGLAFYYSNWSRKASILIANIEEVQRFNYSSNLHSVVQSIMAMRLREGNIQVPDPLSADLLNFLNGTDELLKYEIDIQYIYARFPDIVSGGNIGSNFRRYYDDIAGLFGAAKANDNSNDEIGVPVNLSSPQATDLLTVRAPEAAEAVQVSAIDGRDLFIHVNEYNNYIDRYKEMMSGPLTEQMGIGYAYHVSAIKIRKDQIIGQLEMVSKWTLPAIYGALGAAVFLLVRFLRPFLGNPTIHKVYLRLFFGGLIGITTSILIYPSGLLSFNPNQGSAVILLICFVLGYSIDSFLAVLERANTVISSSINSSGSAK